MSMAKKESFNLGKFLSQSVSDLDTGELEQIEYIDIALLDGDSKNFYAVDGIEELATNIELIGLLDPLRVRATDDGRFSIVSGHRRRAALQMLLDEGNEAFRRVPCIRERAESSEAMRELRLIYANSDTRRMSSADIAKQAERIEALLYQLKEEGVEFPGRMREHVAEACKVSSTKLARLKVIRERLIDEFCGPWEKGALSETAAYRLAQEERKVQLDVAFAHGVRPVCEMTEMQLSAAIDRIKTPPKKEAPSDFKSPALDKIPGKFDAGDYLAQYHEETAQFLDGMRQFCADLLASRLPVSANTRSDSITAMRVTFRNSGHSSRSGGYTARNTTFRMEFPDGGGTISKSWPETWDALALVALERIRKAAAAEDEKEDEPAAAGAWQPLSLLNEPKVGQRVMLMGICDGEEVYSLRSWKPLNAFEQQVYTYWAAVNPPELE